MKIAILSFYSGHFERGVENWTDELSRRLASRGHDVVVFQNGDKYHDSNHGTVLIRLKVDWGVKGFRGTLLRRFFIDYWSVKIAIFTLRVIPKIWLRKFDIVVPTNGGWQVALVRLVTWICRRKMVVVGHSGIGWDDANNLWSFPNVFVALTTEAEKWAERVNPLVKTVFIPDGVDLERFSPCGEKANIFLQKPVILVAGALESGKRIDLTIKAVSKLENASPDLIGASLLVLGRGSLDGKISKMGNKLLGKRFLLTHVAHADLPKYYRACDLFTLPSWRHEAFGMVYLEAMACGLPVVATDDPKRKEIIGDAGILVDPTDITKYSLSLGKALGMKWGDKPRKQAEKFDWEKISEKYENLFKSLLK